MNKAILVIDMPKRCANCPLRCSVNGFQPFCTITFETLSDNEYYNTKPTWCPLKELPKKQKHRTIDNEFQRGAKTGWNYCIDEILKGSEEDA